MADDAKTAAAAANMAQAEPAPAPAGAPAPDGATQAAKRAKIDDDAAAEKAPEDTLKYYECRECEHCGNFSPYDEHFEVIVRCLLCPECKCFVYKGEKDQFVANGNMCNPCYYKKRRGKKIVNK